MPSHAAASSTKSNSGNASFDVNRVMSGIGRFAFFVRHDHRLQKISRVDTQLARESFGLLFGRDGFAEFDQGDKRLMDADLGVVADIRLGPFAITTGEFKSEHGIPSLREEGARGPP